MDDYNYLDGMNEGEKRLYYCCKQFESENFKLIPDALFERADNGTNQIDLICITQKGIFVLEMKDFKGWIFGDENHKEWIQSLKSSYGLSKKYRFRNPVKQNENHIKTIRRILSERGYSLPIYNVVVFGDDAVLKEIDTSIDIVNLSEIKSVFNKYPEVDITLDKLKSTYEFLNNKNIKSNEDRAMHLQYVKGISAEKDKSETAKAEHIASDIKQHEVFDYDRHKIRRKPKNRTKSRKPIESLFISGIVLYFILNLMSGNFSDGKNASNAKVYNNENLANQRQSTNVQTNIPVKEKTISSKVKDSKTTQKVEPKEASATENSSTTDNLTNNNPSNAAMTISDANNSTDNSEELLENVIGVWTGTYETTNNLYNARMEISKSDVKSYVTTFYFETSPNDSTIIKGNYIMDINFNENTKTIYFKGSEWLNRPENYLMVDFETVLVDSHISGKVISLGNTIGTIDLSKSASNEIIKDTTTDTTILKAIAGTWDGSYTANQGVTKVQFVVSQNTDENFFAEVNVGPHKENPNLPQGKWLANLNINEDTKSVEFKQFKWVNQPLGWHMVDFVGVFNAIYIEGKVTHNGQQIGEFKVEK